jgi:hypothetical protein
MVRPREKAATVTDQADQMQQVVCATIRTEIGALRAFVDRRIAELSAEVHATSDLMDFSETNLSGQLKGIREQIANVIATPPRRHPHGAIVAVRTAPSRAGNTRNCHLPRNRSGLPAFSRPR